MLPCNSCGISRKIHDYSKNQRRKKSRRRCKQCIERKQKTPHTTTPNQQYPNCYLMCPHSESSIRLSNNQYHKVFESDLNNKYTKYSLIKEYTRSSAGQRIDLKHVRSQSVLHLTMQYLMNITLNNTQISFFERFTFIEDRIRSIIKDAVVRNLIQQNNNPRNIIDKRIVSNWFRNNCNQHNTLPSNIVLIISIYVIPKYYKQSIIELLEQCIRFRIFCNVLLCHLDQEIQQQTKSCSVVTQYQSMFLKLNVNKRINNKFVYSSVHNLQHIPFLLSHLFKLYRWRDFECLCIQQQKDEMEMYCIGAYYSLVTDSMQNRLVDAPIYIRKRFRIKQGRALIEAYLNMNRALFFKLYYRLSIMEKAVLYPVLDRFRVICISKMCHRKCVRMPPWNLMYSFASFVNDFGFYGNEYDATDFLLWFAGFNENDIERIVKSGLSMDDFCNIKWLNDATRFPARDQFLMEIDSNGLQKIIQSSSFISIHKKNFYDIFNKIETLESIASVDQYINQLFATSSF